MAIVFGLVFVLVIMISILGVPIAFSFGVGTIILFYVTGISPVWAFSTSFSLLSSFVFLALPMYILLGQIVNASGIAKVLANWFISLVPIRGGLGVAAVWTNGVFGAMSGATMPALAGIGSAVLPVMEEQGYPKPYSIGLLIPSATLSALIPPSGAMILFGFMGNLPIASTFLAPFFPGLIAMALLSIIVLISSHKISTIKVPPRVSAKAQARLIYLNTKTAFWALLLPVFCLGGIYAGIYTPVEAAAVGAFYATLISFVVYRTLNFRSFCRCLLNTAILAGSIVIMIFVFSTLTRILIVLQVTEAIVAVINQLSTNLYVQILLLNLLMLLMGTIMDDSSAILMSAIVLLPVAISLGIDPFHFAAMVGTNMVIALITPPVGALLYLGGHIAKLPLSDYIKPTMMFTGALLLVLLLTMYIPWLSTFLPYLLMGS